MKKIFLLLIVFIAVVNCINAQQHNDNSDAFDLIKQIHAVYNNNQNLSFNILYTYADETAPDIILDSVSALVQVKNKQYHLKIGPTETVTNNRYSVMLFSEDKIMYITKPSSDSLAIDPMTKIDSALLSLKGLVTSVEIQKDLKIITIVFPEGSRYRSIRLFVDKHTGLMSKARIIIKNEAIESSLSGGINGEKPAGEYALIEAKYFAYRSEEIDDSVFNEKKYFIRNDKNFSPAAGYQDYKIFIGSPNL